MSRIFAPIALIAILCGPVLAAPPHAIIKGPTSAIPGDLLRLDASESVDAEWYIWDVQVEPPNKRSAHELADGGKTCQLTSHPGRYSVMLVVGNKDGGDVAKWSVVVQSLPGPDPTPAPGPGPSPNPPSPIPPTPTPPPLPTPPPTPVPNGEFGIAADVLAWAQQVQSPNRVAEAQALAAAAESIASAIAAGTLKSLQDVLNAYHQANDKALGPSLALWQPWGVQLSARIEALYHAGKLTSVDALGRLAREIATGLRAVH